jgi:hypothetical protein
VRLTERHAAIDKAADLLGSGMRGRFLLHVRARLAGEPALTDAVVTRVLIAVLGDFGISVGSAYLKHGAKPSFGGRKDAAGALAHGAQRP